MVSLLQLFDNAISQYAAETENLRFLPENRYNLQRFPTVGQYDWFSGQLLYCLVRYVRPQRIIEVSTSSGYSSLFSALALKANQFGTLETFELSPTAAAAAQANFDHYAVQEQVRLWVGDVRETAATLIEQRRQHQPAIEILFLDSEHTEEFARSYLDLFLPDAHPDSLFHMHDILPPEAKVMIRPREAMRSLAFRPKGWLYRRLRKYAPRLVPDNIRRWVTPAPYPGGTSEALFGHRLAALILADQQAYLHNFIDRYPVLDGHRYDSTSVWRCGPRGSPREWNESWWTTCGHLAQAYQTLS